MFGRYQVVQLPHKALKGCRIFLGLYAGAEFVHFRAFFRGHKMTGIVGIAKGESLSAS